MGVIKKRCRGGKRKRGIFRACQALSHRVAPRSCRLVRRGRQIFRCPRPPLRLVRGCTVIRGRGGDRRSPSDAASPLYCLMLPFRALRDPALTRGSLMTVGATRRPQVTLLPRPAAHGLRPGLPPSPPLWLCIPQSCQSNSQDSACYRLSPSLYTSVCPSAHPVGKLTCVFASIPVIRGAPVRLAPLTLRLCLSDS